MTLAIDRISGEVVGQLPENIAWYDGYDSERPPFGAKVKLLTAQGIVSVPWSSVRLEVVR